MNNVKLITDRFRKMISKSSDSAPELVDLLAYFQRYEPISFELKKHEREIVAISTNFQYGSIITSAKTEKELDENIKDAILTSFSVPSIYAQQVGLQRTDNEAAQEKTYALA